MFTRHVSHQLAALIDGQLAEQEARHVEIHATQCARCRAEREQVSFGMEILEQLPLVEAPDAVWVSIEAALREHRSRKTWAVHWWRLAFAASLVLALAGGAYWRAARQSGMRWEVERIEGSHTRGAGHIGAGEWVETDSRSSASVKVGQMGSVEVAPNTRLRVATARPGEHRLSLVRGE